MLPMKDKVALITGGTSGIGEASAYAFAQQGAKVVITGRREELGSAVVEKIKADGGEAAFVRTDIQIGDEVRNMVAKTIEYFGRLDYAINNAGVEQYFKPLVGQSERVYQLIMDTNVKGVWMSMQAEIPAMLETGGGAIVNVSSVFGLVGAMYGPLYSASKHAVIGLTKSVALEFAKQNIRVNALLPGAVETPMIGRLVEGNEKAADQLNALHPIGRAGRPEEIAETCVWLCSEKAGFITGSSVSADGGYTAQ
ncbi:MAG: glucose 1-dehydrogenase [Acidobacteria bacterium]|nr:glucose 1-dehydrogenase [Acidobacteriota bacterium]